MTKMTFQFIESEDKVTLFIQNCKLRKQKEQKGCRNKLNVITINNKLMLITRV